MWSAVDSSVPAAGLGEGAGSALLADDATEGELGGGSGVTVNVRSPVSSACAEIVADPWADEVAVRSAPRRSLPVGVLSMLPPVIPTAPAAVRAPPPIVTAPPCTVSAPTVCVKELRLNSPSCCTVTLATGDSSLL